MSHLDAHHQRRYLNAQQSLHSGGSRESPWFVASRWTSYSFSKLLRIITAPTEFCVWGGSNHGQCRFLCCERASIVDQLFVCSKPDRKRFDIPRAMIFFVLDFSLRGLQRFSRRLAAMMHSYSKTRPLAKTLVQECDSSLLAATATLYVLFLSNILPYLYRLSGSLSK